MTDGVDSIVTNDLALVKRARTDRAAENLVFRRVYPGIFRIVRTAVRGRKEAEDIAQLAAMQVLRSLDSFRGIGTLEAWAERIAYRTALRSIRRTRRGDLLLCAIEESDVMHTDTPEHSLARRRMFDELAAQLQEIPTKRRVPLLLHLAYGYTVKEVSQITNASTNTVKARLKVGMRELRVLLENHPQLLDSLSEDAP